MLRKRTLMAVVGLASALLFSAAPAMAHMYLYLDYDVKVSYDAGSGLLTVEDDTDAFAKAEIYDSNDPGKTALDRADIANGAFGAGTFDVLLTATVSNPAGLNNIALTSGLLKATDTLTTLANPSIHARAYNVPYAGDADGIGYSGGVLSIHGELRTSLGNASILLNPAGPGSWTYKGEDDGSLGVGADGVADQVTITDPPRDSYDEGTWVVFQINLSKYSDNTDITATNADDLFGAGKDFSASGGDLKVDVVPVPGAAVLGLIGLGLVAAWRKRRSA